MKIVASETEYTVDTPLFGYETTIHLSTMMKKTTGGQYFFWDNTATYDYRMLRCTWLLSLAQTDTLIDIIKDEDKGRAQNIQLELDAGSGFFPFGPDKGDEGTFGVRLVSVDPKPTIGHPENYFHTECGFVFNGSYPAYTPPDQVEEGDLQIGTIEGLRYPQDYHTQEIRYAVDVAQTYDGTPHALDREYVADTYEATLPLVMNESNAAALVAHLTGTVRANNVGVTPPSNSYIFGRENAGTAIYSCKLVQNELTITHNNHDLFAMGLTFAYRYLWI